MKKACLSLLSLVLSFTVYSQNPKPFASSIKAADLKLHLAIIASGDMEGRETATQGQRKAAGYIETQFKSIGLLPGNGTSYQLSYPVYRDSLVSATLEVNGLVLEQFKDFQSIMQYNNTSSQNFAEVVFADLFLLFHAKGAVVRCNDLQIIERKAAPQIFLLFFGA